MQIRPARHWPVSTLHTLTGLQRLLLVSEREKTARAAAVSQQTVIGIGGLRTCSRRGSHPIVRRAHSAAAAATRLAQTGRVTSQNAAQLIELNY